MPNSVNVVFIEGSLQIIDVQRWDNESGRRITVSRTNCVTAYNRVGRVDVNDYRATESHKEQKIDHSLYLSLL